MRLRLGLVVALALVAAGVVHPPPAAAHALSGRADLPIPEWLFGWAAAIVLVVSFIALAVLWPSPRLEDGPFRPIPRRLGRILTSRAVEILCGTTGVFLLAVVVWSGLFGSESVTGNFAPTFVYVIFWLGLVPASILFGDVFRAFNPWRAIGRGTGWAVRHLVGGSAPAVLPYPERLGRWPAAAGLFAFAWIELASAEGAEPRNVAAAAFVYTGLTLVGMTVYGVDRWTDRAEAFSVYFGLFSRLAPFERRGEEIGVRRPLSGLAGLERLPGTVLLLGIMIGATTFDGAGEGELWGGIAVDTEDWLTGIGLGVGLARELTSGIGLVLCVALVFGFYHLGVAGARRAGGGGDRLSAAFVHSLVPIALAYVSAHYVTLLLFQGQAIAALASDPLGSGWDLFGTAGWAIDYGLIGATTTWYLQVAFVVTGHVLALTLAHDRALVLYERSRVAVQSQYWMLAVMVGFTSLALWLLSQANA